MRETTCLFRCCPLCVPGHPGLEACMPPPSPKLKQIPRPRKTKKKNDKRFVAHPQLFQKQMPTKEDKNHRTQITHGRTHAQTNQPPICLTGKNATPSSLRDRELATKLQSSALESHAQKTEGVCQKQSRNTGGTAVLSLLCARKKKS